LLIIWLLFNYSELFQSLLNNLVFYKHSASDGSNSIKLEGFENYAFHGIKLERLKGNKGLIKNKTSIDVKSSNNIFYY
jgi:hypothetical protein